MKRSFGLCLIASLCPLAGFAQEAEPGGVFFTFDLGQTFEASSDRDLETPEREDGLESLTTLRFGAVTETRAERLSFSLGSELRISEGELTDDGLNAQLAYSRNSADARFDISLSADREDIAFLRDASDFLDDDGIIVLPDDFDDLIGSGTRSSATFAASLLWGETAPVGYNLSVSRSALRYQDASAALADNDSATLGFGVRLNINEVTTTNIDLNFSQTEDDGLPREEAISLTGSVTFARPRGDLTTRAIVLQDEEDEIFWAAAISRDYALAEGSLSGELGVAEDEDGEARLTGRVTFSMPQPSGQIDLRAEHGLPPGGDSLSSTVSASYLQELSPVSSMRVGFNYGRTSDSDGEGVIAVGSLTASYGISLTDVWDLSIGASANMRDSAGTRNNSGTVFLTLERPFSWRP